MTYKVAYYKMGKLTYDNFSNLEDAKKDYNIKLKLDKDGVFDDRFVVGIYQENKEDTKLLLDRFNRKNV